MSADGCATCNRLAALTANAATGMGGGAAAEEAEVIVIDDDWSSIINAGRECASLQGGIRPAALLWLLKQLKGNLGSQSSGTTS